MKSESVKKSLEKSKNVLGEMRKNGRAKNLHKKDQHVYNNCYKLRSRAIKMVLSKVFNSISFKSTHIEREIKQSDSNSNYGAKIV